MWDHISGAIWLMLEDVRKRSSVHYFLTPLLVSCQVSCSRFQPSWLAGTLLLLNSDLMAGKGFLDIDKDDIGTGYRNEKYSRCKTPAFTKSLCRNINITMA